MTSSTAPPKDAYFAVVRIRDGELFECGQSAQECAELWGAGCIYAWGLTQREANRRAMVIAAKHRSMEQLK